MIFLVILIGFFIVGTIIECLAEEYQWHKIKNERKEGKRID